MTITLNLNTDSIAEDLKTLRHLFKCESESGVDTLSNFLKPLSVSFKPFQNNTTIQVSLEEFALIGIFNKGIK